ncbi:MAG: hypothetical protein ACYTFY_11410 [Planctomycetota bacterium]
MIKVWYHAFKDRQCAKVYSTESEDELIAWAGRKGFGRDVIHYSRKDKHPHIDLIKKIKYAEGLPEVGRREMVEDVRDYFTITL